MRPPFRQAMPLMVVIVLSRIGLPADAVRVGAACETIAIKTARDDARALARRDPTAAWSRLRPLVQRRCAANVPEHPTAAEHRMALACAWLLNDALVYFTDPGYKGTDHDDPLGTNRTERPACYAILLPLFDDELHPLPWLTTALKRVAIANVRASARNCVPMMCAPLNSQVWDACRSKERQFVSRTCPFAPGQIVDANH